MPVALVTSGQTAWDNITTPKTATVSWAAGDIIVIRAATEKGDTVADLPTATGLTFSQVADEGSGSNAECDATIFAATAGAAGSGVTVSMTRSGPSSGFFGFHWGVYSGASGVTGGTGNVNESTTNLTTAAGDAVVMILADFAATNPFSQTPTGSGTATEHVEGFFTQYSVGVVDWIGTTAGTTAYGYTSYAGLTAASAFLVLTAGAPTTTANAGVAAVGVAAADATITTAYAQLTQTHYRWGLDDGTEAGHTFDAAEDADITVATGLRRLLRVQLDETAGLPATAGYTLQYRRVGDPDWRTIE